MTLRGCYQYETIFNKGDEGNCFYIVLTGEVFVLLEKEMNEIEREEYEYNMSKVR